MIQNCNSYKVLKIFLNEPLKGFRLREISRKIKLGLPSVSNYIKQLEKEQLVIKNENNGIKLWFANREAEIFKKHKIADNIISLEKRGLLNFLDEEKDYPTIILFGSWANGEDTEKSDIDLCIISENKKELNLEKFRDIFGREIQIFLFNEKEFKMLKIKSPELFNSILNGIILRGFIKIK